MSRLAVGDRAPAFTLSDDRGKKIALSAFKGQRVVVYFYPADDTPGCTKQACQFNDELAAFSKLNVPVIGISPDDQTSHEKFRQKYKLKFTLLSDPDRRVMTKYGAYGEKKLYGKTVVGVIRSSFVVGATGRIEQALYAVRADGNAEKVMKFLATP